MPGKRIGQQTMIFPEQPFIIGRGSVVGKKEGDGPLSSSFDLVERDVTFGEKSWEKAETAMQKAALEKALERAGVSSEQLDVLLAGDLLDQCTGSGYAARGSDIPFLGLYGACSTMGEGLGLAALLVDGGYAGYAAAVTSSHFCSAQRQYRTPLEYGSQRTPTAQWTVTGAGAVILARHGSGPRVTHFTAGTVVDRGIKDANNMGAAMAPAAYETLRAHFRDAGRKPAFYDCIVTGDLGSLGTELLQTLFKNDGLALKSLDCGVMIYDARGQDAHCGGSGCGCSASVLAGYLLPEMERGRWKNILFCPTGALLSPTSIQQGESIPGICHAIAITVKD